MKRTHIILGIAAACIGLTTPLAAKANESVKTQLEQRKKDFMESAPQQKQDDYEEGIKLVEESGVLESAKNVGDRASDFTLGDALNKDVNLYETLAQGPVVLIWYRGEWCPYCNIYLHALEQRADEFKAQGATIIAISPATPDKSWNDDDKADLKLRVLSDGGNKVAQDYGVVYTLPPKIAEYYQNGFDLHAVNNDESDQLPLAASYVIAQDKTISYAYLNADYRERAEIDDLLSEVKKLKMQAE